MGLAMRVEKTPQYPYAITLGALPESEKHFVYEVGKQIGLDLKSVGIHYNLAPLADINNRIIQLLATTFWTKQRKK
jgi:beta-glucosidase-like glycosyl hydrolase